MNKYSFLVKNEYAYSILTKIISVALGFIYAILYSRYMGAEYRGVSSVIINYSDLIMLVACMGVYQAYPFYKKKNLQENLYIDFVNIIFGLFFLLLLICVSLILVFDFNLINTCILILVPFLMIIKQLNYVVMIENPTLRNTSQLIIEILSILLLVLLFFLTKSNLFYCITFLFIKEFIAFIISIYNLKINIIKIRPKLTGSFKYVKYGILPMITVLLMEINYKVDVVMLEKMSVSMSEIGVYSLGILLAQKVWILPDALKDILTSKLSKGSTYHEVSKITRVSIFLVLLCIFALIIMGKPLITILFGQEFEKSYDVILTIIFGTIGMVIYKMVYAYNVVNGDRISNLVMLFVTALSNIIANFLLIPQCGIFGAALASTISYTICGICFLISFCIKTRAKWTEVIFVSKADIVQIKNLKK